MADIRKRVPIIEEKLRKLQSGDIAGVFGQAGNFSKAWEHYNPQYRRKFVERIYHALSNLRSETIHKLEQSGK